MTGEQIIRGCEGIVAVLVVGNYVYTFLNSKFHSKMIRVIQSNEIVHMKQDIDEIKNKGLESLGQKISGIGKSLDREKEARERDYREIDRQLTTVAAATEKSLAKLCGDIEMKITKLDDKIDTTDKTAEIQFKNVNEKIERIQKSMNGYLQRE